MSNSICFLGPAFSLTGDVTYPAQGFEFQFAFNNSEEQESVKAYQWYLDGTIVVGQNLPGFIGNTTCGTHTIGARILSAEGWSGVKTLMFKTCRYVVSAVIVGPDEVAYGDSVYYGIIETYNDGTTVDTTQDYIFNSPDGSFNGSVFTATENSDPTHESVITATGTQQTLTKNITVFSPVASILIQGPNSVYEGEAAVYKVIKTYVNSTAVDVTPEFVLSSPDGSFSGGIFTPFAISTGSKASTIRAAKEGVTVPFKPITILANIDQAGILGVDIFDDNTLNIAGYYESGDEEIYLRAYTGSNIAPAETLPADALIVASDVIVQTGNRLKWRFDFNIAKLITDYPEKTEFDFYIKGRSATAGTMVGAFVLKLFEAEIILTGSPGTYIPTTSPPDNLKPSQSFSASIGGGANGSYAENIMATVIRFTYHKSTATITVHNS